MPSFVDMKGRKWTLVLSIGLADRIKSAVGVDFLSKNISAALNCLANDPMKLVGVLWEMCAEEAEKRGVQPEELAASLGGDAVSDASDALMESIVDFTRRSMRPAMQKALDAARKAEEQMGQRAVEALDRPGLMEAVMAEVLSESESGKSPESST